MTDKVICHVLAQNGKYKKYTSKNGENFIAKDGKSYNAPKAENYEILDYRGFLGEKRLAFYRYAEPDAIPLNKRGKWKETTNHDADVNMLVEITRQALNEEGLADKKINAMLAGQGLLILVIIIQALMR